MTEKDKELLIEALQLLDDSLARLMDCKNEELIALGNIIYGAMRYGELIQSLNE